jgi:hypothetical protein
LSYHRAAASRNALLIAIAASALAACRGGPGSSPQAAAERFLDKYYVELAPSEALPLTRGTAEAQIREVIRLKSEAGPGGEGAGAVRPRVYWERLGASQGEGGVELLRYRLRIDTGGVAMVREVAVRVERVEASWKVTGFTEGEATP